MFEQNHGVMIDLETLGYLDDTVITQIGAVIFDLVSGEILDTLVVYHDITQLDDRFHLFQEDLLNIDYENSELILNQILPNHRELMNEYSISERSLQFWCSKKENYEKLGDILTHKDAVSEEIMINKLYNFINNHEKARYLRIWGNGISFDVVKINKLFEKYDLKSPIFFTKERDVRTLLEMACFVAKKDVKWIKKQVPKNKYTHDALEDALFQVAYCHKCYQIITGVK